MTLKQDILDTFNLVTALDVDEIKIRQIAN